MRWAGHVASVKRRMQKGLGLTARRRETIKRPGRRWEENIKMDLSKIG
jgi:hypothetical protein